jgi:phosphoribosyl-ATP pyrophosphohydrolase
MSEPPAIIRQLADVVAQRYRERPAGSYTTELFAAGHGVMAAKLVEEVYELVAHVAEEDPASHHDVVHEAADLVYHLLVALTAVGVEWPEVERELQRRFGVSGLAEKAGRPT